MKNRKITALVLTLAMSAAALSGCASLGGSESSTEESTSETTTEAASEETTSEEASTEESTESTTESSSEETTEEASTEESTEEGSTLSAAEEAAVGTYIGGNGSCFTLHADATCSFYDLNSTEVQDNLTWSISGSKINIVWRSAGLILTAEVPDDYSSPIEVTGNNSSWNAELFAKVSDEDEELTGEDYQAYRSNLFSFPDWEEASDYDTSTNQTATLSGVEYQVPENYGDGTDNGTSVSYVVDDGDPGTEVILAMESSNGFSGSIFVSGLLSGLDAEGTWIKDYTFSDDGADAIVTGITTTDDGTTYAFRADAHYVTDDATVLYAIVFQPMDAEYSHFDDLDSIFTSFVQGYESAASTSGGYSGGSAGSSGGAYDSGSYTTPVDPTSPVVPGIEGE